MRTLGANGSAGQSGILVAPQNSRDGALFTNWMPDKTGVFSGRMADEVEKRAQQRLPLVLRVEYADQAGALRDCTENLSAGGIFIRTDKDMHVGERVSVQISFPGLLEPFAITGEVAWVRPAGLSLPRGVGVRIPEDRAEDRARLQALFHRLEQAAAPPEEAPVLAEEPPRRAYRILLVEDNPHVLEMYRYALRRLAREGTTVEVVIAEDGHQALTRIRTEPRFDLVIADLYMPVLDGFTLIRKIRANPATQTLPVMAISGGGPDARREAEESGVDVYLQKPVRFVDVLTTVKLLLKIQS